MQLEGQTMSQTYLDWMLCSDEALDEDDAEKAAVAYAELDKILHPESQQMKLMKIQMASIPPSPSSPPETPPETGSATTETGRPTISPR